MTSKSAHISGLDRGIIAVMMALGAALLSFRLGWQEYWWDEHVTVMFTRAGWYELMITHWGTDTHRPVYYGLQKAWNSVFGESTAAVRSLPIAITVLIVPFFFLTARRIASGPLALITVIVLISAPMFVVQGREVRMYCLTNLALAIALWCAAELAVRARARMAGTQTGGTGRENWLWAGFAAALALAFYAQAMGILVTALFGFWILLCVALRVLPLWFLWKSLAAFVLYCVLILPALYPFLVHATGTLGDSFWIPEPSIRYVYEQTATAYPYPKWTKPVVALMILWGLWSLRGKPHIALLMGMMVVGLPALVLGISLFKPIYIWRVVAWGSFVSVLVLAAGLAPLRPSLRWGGVAFLVIAQLFAFQNFLPPAPETVPERIVAAQMQDFDPDKDILVLGQQPLEPAMRSHVPVAFEGTAYGFIYGDRNSNVIDSAFRTVFVPRAQADQIKLEAEDGARLFVVYEDPVPEFLKVVPEDLTTEALDTVVGGRTPSRSFSDRWIHLDVYDLN